MIFKFFKQDKTPAGDTVEAAVAAEEPVAPAPPQPPAAADEAAVAVAASSPASPPTTSVSPPALPPAAQRLSASELSRTTDAAAWGGKGSSALQPLAFMSSHTAALAGLDAIVVGHGPAAGGFVLTPSESFLGPALAAHLGEVSRELQPASDWVYVVDPATDRHLQALPLPPGRAPALRDSLAAAIDELRATIPAVLSTSDYDLRRQTIAEEVRLACEDRIDALRARAKAQNVALLRTPSGYTLAPIHDGKAVRAEVFAALPAPMQREVEVRVGTLERDLVAILEDNSAALRSRRRRLLDLEAETVAPHVAAALADVRAAFADTAAVAAHLAAVEQDIVRNASQFVEPRDRATPMSIARDGASAAAPRRYLPEIAVTRSTPDAAVPVVPAAPLTRSRLTGAISAGRVLPGLVHAAHGGILLVDGRDLAADGAASSAMMRMLRSRLVEPELTPAAGLEGAVSAVAPIPLAATVVVVGDRETLERLRRAEPGFDALLPVVGDLSRPLPRSAGIEAEAARVIAGLAGEVGGLPLEAGALARLVDECARLAGDRDHIVVGSGCIAELLRDAAFRSRRAGLDAVSREHVVAAVAARQATRPQATRGAAEPRLWSAPPAVAGGTLAVAASGQPVAVTVRVGRGRGRPRDIVCPAAHDASRAAVLWSLVAGGFAPEAAMPLAAAVTHSPLGPDDAATAAAEACALLSALAEAPVTQPLAVIGGIDAEGALCDVCDIADRIERYQALAAGSGLPPGVLVPRASLPRLMLREAVSAAVEAGTFSVHAASHVDEVLALLTGLPAGTRGANIGGRPQTLRGRILARLAALAAAPPPSAGHGEEASPS